MSQEGATGQLKGRQKAQEVRYKLEMTAEPVGTGYILDVAKPSQSEASQDETLASHAHNHHKGGLGSKPSHWGLTFGVGMR